MSPLDEAQGGRSRSWREGLGVAAAVGLPIVAARVLAQPSLSVVLLLFVVIVLGLGVLGGGVTFGFGVVSNRRFASLWRVGLLIALVLVLIGLRAGLEVRNLDPVETRPLDRVAVTLVDDPRPATFGWRAIARVDQGYVQLTVAAGNETAAAGDRLIVSGTQRGQPPTSDWAVSRRIVGTVSASRVHQVVDASGPIGAANAVRDSVRSGGESLSTSRRVLFTGLVFGDDRGQDVIVADNFRAAGLGHLLAVSGQNVVFVLLLAAPLLSRVRSIPARVALTVAVLIAFGFLTRFEASVTRALMMAGLAVLAHAVGRPAQAAIVLPPAVVVLLLINPLLAWSLAFQLSVAATLGLVVLAPWIIDMLPGPQPLRLAIGATLAAQLAVAPLLFWSFGQVSVVAVPANLLAAPAAAGVMMWGLVAGPIAGLSPDWLAASLHLPTRLLLWWIDSVAATFARFEPGQFTPWHLAAGITTVVAWRFANFPRPFVLALAVATVAPIAVTPKPLPAGHHVLASGVTVFRSVQGHDVLVLETGARADDLVASVRHARLGRIDLVISTSGSRADGRLVALLDRRFDVLDVWAPAGHQVPRGRVVDEFTGSVGTLAISWSATGELEIRQM